MTVQEKVQWAKKQWNLKNTIAIEDSEEPCQNQINIAEELLNE